jgi:hypothetical protein
MRPVSTWDLAWQRLAVTGLLLALLVLLLWVFGRAIGLPDGYGSAQSLRASDLAARDDWHDLRRGATLDIVVFVPAYVAAATGLAWIVTASARRRVLAPLVFGAVADLVETLLFRRSLSRLIGGATADDIETLANATRVATVLKYGGILVAGIALVVIAARGESASAGEGDHSVPS